MPDPLADSPENWPSEPPEPTRTPSPELRATAQASDFAAPMQPMPFPAALQHLADAARGYANLKNSPNTARAYASDWRLFERWCRTQAGF